MRVTRPAMKKVVYVFTLISAYGIICDCFYTEKTNAGFGDCARLQAAELGTYDRLTFNGLVAQSFGGGDAGIEPQLVRIISHQTVCEVFGLRRGTFAGTSAIVTYECEGVRCGDSGAHKHIRVNRTDHFHFACLNQHGGTGSYFPPETGARDIRVRTPATSNRLQISVDTRCGRCADPVTSGSSFTMGDIDTHCICKFCIIM